MKERRERSKKEENIKSKKNKRMRGENVSGKVHR